MTSYQSNDEYYGKTAPNFISLVVTDYDIQSQNMESSRFEVLNSLLRKRMMINSKRKEELWNLRQSYQRALPGNKVTATRPHKEASRSGSMAGQCLPRARRQDILNLLPFVHYLILWHALDCVGDDASRRESC